MTWTLPEPAVTLIIKFWRVNLFSTLGIIFWRLKFRAFWPPGLAPPDQAVSLHASIIRLAPSLPLVWNFLNWGMVRAEFSHQPRPWGDRGGKINRKKIIPLQIILSGPLLWVFHQNFLNQGFCTQRQILFRKYIHTILNPPVRGFNGSSFKRHPSYQQRIHNNSKTPDINLKAMPLAGQDFRGDIIGGSAHTFASLLLAGNPTSQAEISEFLILIPVYKQIW